MSGAGRSSLRTQLVVGNVAALALLLTVLGVVVHYAAAAAILASIDRELDARTHPPPGSGGPPHGPPPNGGGQFSPNGGPPPDERGRFAPERGFPPPDGNGGRFRPPPQEDGPFSQNADRPPFRRSNGPPPDDQYGPRVFNVPGSNSAAPWDGAMLARAAAGQIVFSTVRVDGERLRVISRPFPEGGHGRRVSHGRRVLQCAYPLADADRALAGLNRALLILLPFALLCAGAVGTLLTGRVLRRVGAMTARISQMGVDDLSTRLSAIGGDEFAALADTVNGLLARLETAFRRQKQSMEQQRRFTADASHELKTPLTVIRGSTSLALSGQPSQEQYHEMMTDMDEAAQQMENLVADLLLLARADAGNLALSCEVVPLTALTEQVAARARRPGLAHIWVDVAPDAPAVSGSRSELSRVFSNLLDNALRYTPPEGQVTLSVRGSGKQAVITVSDTGTGIAPKHLPHLGERFYRVDASRTAAQGGTGLGLSICRGIVDAHGGSMTIESESGTGTTVTVTLPCLPK